MQTEQNINTKELFLKKESGMSRTELNYWTLLQAVKELAQNYVFGCQTSINNKQGITFYDHENNQAIFEDYNESGIELKYLLIGNSGQRELENSPGEFGEGMKKALLIAEREQKQCIIETVKYTITGKFELGSLNTEEFIFNIYRNDRTIGTKFTIECDEQIYLEAISCFGYISNPNKKDLFQDNNILEVNDDNEVNKVYINGVNITSSTRSLATYNIIGKGLNVRDRDKLESSQINQQLWQNIISLTKNKKLIAKILDTAISNDYSYIEVYNIKYNLLNDTLPIWKEVLKSKYGKRICYSEGNEYLDRQVSYKNFNVFKNLGWSCQSLLQRLDVPSSNEIMQKANGIVGNVVLLKDLSRKAKDNVKQCRSLIQKHYCENIWNFKFIEDLHDTVGNKCFGLCNYNEHLIYIDYGILEDIEQLFATILHETVHQKTKEHDCTAEFENELCKAALTFAKGCTRRGKFDKQEQNNEFEDYDF